MTTQSCGLNPDELFPFPLDDFQKQAINHLDSQKSILVCAPTGSGKTLIAEYAIYKALNDNKKIFYTTPLKALSNQKFFDFCNKFGEDKVGLLTGDLQVNRNADILVLTTEIFRNMLYKADTETELFNRSGYLVLDECHFMKDPDRGTVWEESIIYCPHDVQIIALSATVGNPEELQDWMTQIHPPVELIKSEHRPVPLRFFFLTKDEMKPLINAQGKINTNLFKMGKRTSSKRDGFPTISETLMRLKEKDMLPVIYFLFSRRGCEEALKRTSRSDLIFLSDIEKQELESYLDEACKQLDWLKTHPHFHALKKGVASHHAGMLPAMKSLVERLFQKNLIKVVFATETLAAGINMPARSVVISQISKRSDYGHRLLNSSEFYQMGGRAGRRGMDPVGYVVVLETAYEGAFEVASLASSPVEDLKSSFSASYIMVLNLTSRFSWESCKNLVTKSFLRFEKHQEIKSLKNTEYQLSETLERKLDDKKEKKTTKRLKKIHEELHVLENIPWPDFEKTSKVLLKMGYLNEGSMKPTEKGLWALDLRSDNILFLAELINRKILEELSPYELAGVCCAIAGQEMRFESQSKNSWAITEKIENCVRKIYTVISELSEIQYEFDVDYRIPFIPSYIELGFDWTSVYDWEELKGKYQTDEGDLVKILRQASDLLKQITVCKGSSFDLASNANKAFEMIYRSPIKDEINFEDN
jgi:superfamily II RNA helicase